MQNDTMLRSTHAHVALFCMAKAFDRVSVHLTRAIRAYRQPLPPLQGQLVSCLTPSFHPFGTTASVHDELFMTDMANHRVRVLSAIDGAELRTWGGRGSNPGRFNFPVGIAVAPSSGEIVVVDCGNRRVQVFRPDGGFVRQWSYAIRSISSRSVAVTQAGVVALSERDGCHIQLFRLADGELLHEWEPTHPFGSFAAVCVVNNNEVRVCVCGEEASDWLNPGLDHGC